MNDNIITPVILAGGKGTRLWPLSRTAMPKQFCKLNSEPSLFQQTIERLCMDPAFSAPVILTNETYLSLVQTQLHEIHFEAAQIICEPSGRDTAAAVALATLAGKQQDQDILLVLPSDHKILDGAGFLNAAREAAGIAQKTGKIITFGIKPSGPATGYGYLKAGASISGSGGYDVQCFIEKPDLETAKKLIASDEVFWNAGIFMFTRAIMRDELKTHAADLYHKVETSWKRGIKDKHCVFPEATAFSEIAPISIDYAVMEKTSNVVLVPVDPQWSDVGSWGAVWKVSKRDANGNAVVGNVVCNEVVNSYVSSDGPLVGVTGVSDLVVVANRDAVLVTSRSNSQTVKQLMQEICVDHEALTHQHIGEHRPWGSFTSLHKGENHQVKTITVEPGGQLSLQYHFHRAEHWIVVAGTPTVTVDDKVMQLSACQQIFIPQGSVHRLENLTSELVEIIEVQYGSYLGEDDIVRVEDVYGRPEIENAGLKDKVA